MAMAADVSYLVRVMNGYNNNTNNTNNTNNNINSTNNNKEEQQQGKSAALITRDLLGGGCSAVDSKELDLDLQVPDGYEKRLDLKTGKVYLQRCDPPKKSASPPEHKKKTSETVSNLQDLNFPPVSKQSLLSLFDDTNLDLKLVHSSPPSSKYQSVCTLDKVKSALERAEKETIRKRSISMSQSSSQSNSSSSLKETAADHVDSDEKSPSSFAAGCPSCLLYVLITKNSPKCPRCNMTVPSPMLLKKPRIDLNISI